MIIPAHFRIAIKSLRSTRFRTTLTTLGIVIGVAAMMMVMALGEGIKKTFWQQVEGQDSRLIVVRPGNQSKSNTITAVNPYTTAFASSLTEFDAQSIQKLKQVDQSAILMLLNGTSKGQAGNSANTTIAATNQNFANLLHLKTQTGQFLDSTTSNSTVVLGYSLAISLLGTERAMGQEVNIKGQPHTVIGVLHKSQSSLNLAGIDIDNSAYVNFEQGKKLNHGIGQVQQIFATTAGGTSLNDTQTAINATISKNHGGENDYTVLAGSQISTSTNGLYNLIVGVTTAVATVSLVVGGIGIMNVMLVSVTERTREIGIRKALGATNQQILLQFLIEAALITIVGVLIGLGIAYGFSYIVASFMGFKPDFNPQSIAISTTMALCVGIIFGLFPALRAAHRNPIQALRQYS